METTEDTTVEEPRAGRGGFGLGLLVGAVVGAAFALLLAPDSGRETRHRLRRRLGAVRERAREGFDELDDRVREEIRRRRR